MSRGERRHLVQLANPGDPVPDADGGFTEVYAPLDPPTWYCAIAPATVADSQRVVAGTMQTTATHLIRGDFHPGITTETRIVFGAKRYEVQSVQNDDERNISLTLVCVEIKGAPSGSAQRVENSGTGGTASSPAPVAPGIND